MEYLVLGVKTNQVESILELIESSQTCLYASSSSSSSKDETQARLDIEKEVLEIDSIIARELSSILACEQLATLARILLDFLARDELEIS